MSNSVKKSKIEIHVGLDDQNHPSEITWTSDDHPDGPQVNEAKAMLLAFFDKAYLDTYKIDIWTNELQVVEMDRLMFQTLRALADTYNTATRNTSLANDMQRFVEYFGEQTGIIKKEE